jgi:hypothetical protein
MLVALLFLASLAAGNAACPAGKVPWPSASGAVDCQDLKVAISDSRSFLEENKPSWDEANHDTIADGVIEPTVNVSLAARMSNPWAAEVPKEIFFDYVLPYASVNEARSDWRQLFSRVLQPFVHNATFTATSLSEAAVIINDLMWVALSSNGNAIKFKSEQTPLIFDPMSTIVYGYASCTGISIMYIDALRSVGIPARLVGTPAWNGNVSHGNHNWVEVWTNVDADSPWGFVEGRPAGGGETLTNPCDKWFCDKAKFGTTGLHQTKAFATKFSKNSSGTTYKPCTAHHAPHAPHAIYRKPYAMHHACTHIIRHMHPISYATCTPEAVSYPMAWDPHNKEIPGVDRTGYYSASCSKC